MISCFLAYFKGFYKISLNNNIKIINILKARNINIWNIIEKDNALTLNIYFKDYDTFCDICKNHNFNFSILKEWGIKNSINNNKWRFSIIFSIIFFILLIYTSTLFVWKINISGFENRTEDEIINYLNSISIKEGCFKYGIDKFDLEKNIRKEFDDFCFVSCNIIGTTLNITVKETLDVYSDTTSLNPCDIIASKDGTIYKIIVAEGVPLVKEGTEIKKGDILVSGTMYLYDDNQEIMDTEYISSKANVTAISKRNYLDSISLTYYSKRYSENEETDHSFSIFSTNINLIRTTPKFKKYDTSTKCYQLHIGKYLYFPIKFYKKTYKEYSLNRVDYDEKEAKELALKHLQIYIDELKEKGVQILQNNVKISMEKEHLVAKGEIVVIEGIGVPKDIDSGKED